MIEVDVSHIGDVDRPDIALVGALARLALNLGARGDQLVLIGVSPRLRELIEFAGLTQVLLNT